MGTVHGTYEILEKYGEIQRMMRQNPLLVMSDFHLLLVVILPQMFHTAVTYSKAIFNAPCITAVKVVFIFVVVKTFTSPGQFKRKHSEGQRSEAIEDNLSIRWVHGH